MNKEQAALCYWRNAKQFNADSKQPGIAATQLALLYDARPASLAGKRAFSLLTSRTQPCKQQRM